MNAGRSLRAELRDLKDKRALTAFRNLGPRLLSNAIVQLDGAALVDDAPCWAWAGGTGGKHPKVAGQAYGVFNYRCRRFLAHRATYEFLHGPIPAGLQLDHLCRNRLCVNPAHLEPVTGEENNRRSESRSAQNIPKTHCGTCGTPYDDANTYRHGAHRYCRECHRASQRRRRAGKADQ